MGAPSTHKKYCLTSCTRPKPELSLHACIACNSHKDASLCGQTTATALRCNTCHARHCSHSGPATILTVCSDNLQHATLARSNESEHHRCACLVIVQTVAEGDDAKSPRFEHSVDLRKHLLRLQQHIPATLHITTVQDIPLQRHLSPKDGGTSAPMAQEIPCSRKEVANSGGKSRLG